MTVSDAEELLVDRPAAAGAWSWGAFLRGAAGGALLGVMFAALWFGVTGFLAFRDASALRAGAQRLEAAVGASDFPATLAELNEARARAASLDDRLSSAPWSWAQSLPWVGPSVAAGATVVAAADEVLGASEGLSAALESASGADLLGAALVLQGSGTAVQETADAAGRAADAVALLDPAAVLPPLREPLRTVQSQLAGALGPIADGAALAPVLPPLLGVGDPARWLVVLSQPSEARGSGGGFYGAWMTVTVSDGRFTLGQAAANGPETAVKQDLSTLPAEYRRLWGSDAEYLWGFNLSRHYPYTAPVIHRELDPGADFVVSLDPRTVAGLIALTGPVEADGVQLDASNAEDFFARGVYVQYPDSTEKDQVTLAFLQQVFGKLGAAESLAPADLWRALGGAIGGGHMQVWSPDPAMAAALEPTRLGGAVPVVPAPWVTVAFNNSAGNKIDSYVDTSVAYRAAGTCDAVRGSVEARLTIDDLEPGLPGYISGRNDEPGAPYGTSSMLVHIYGPSGARGLGSVTVNGAPVSAVQGSERGHPVWGVKVQLAPGAPAVVRAEFEQPPFPGQPLEIGAQPMVRDTAVTVVDDRSC